MNRTTNSAGQVTVTGRLVLKQPTVMTRHDKAITVPAGTTVDYAALEGVLHVVSHDTPQGTFIAIKYVQVAHCSKI